MSSYSVNQNSVKQILAAIHDDRIAIPELQRPFVWKSSQVRDLMDSLYKGYPVGYLITWQSVGAKLKGGEIAAHQQILIDGQQRVTALRAAIAGLPVVGSRYEKKNITIAFNPVTEEFATLTPAIRKSSQWVHDISTFFGSSKLTFLGEYCRHNPEEDPAMIETALEKLAAIENAQIGVISLDDHLPVEVVAEIFVRINARGVPLSSADFVMSKIATYGDEGRNLRKLIDYFCHLSVAGHAYDDIRENDREFAQSGLLDKISWLSKFDDDIFQPTYSDIIRIAGLVGFNRGKASSIVSELSGLNPETRKTDESLIPAAYKKLGDALLDIVRQTHFERFLLMIRSIGFVSGGMIGSKNALNFTYALYLKLRQLDMTEPERSRAVKRWFVMTLLTGRAVGSFESIWEMDLRHMEEQGIAAYLRNIEEGELGEDFWRVALPQQLMTPSKRSPSFQVYTAALINSGARGFLSKEARVDQMFTGQSDTHHIVPKSHLIKNGIAKSNEYNQVANLTLTETHVNLAISNEPPTEYMATVLQQIETGELKIGELCDREDLDRNLAENAIPESIFGVTAESYWDFLAERRKKMALIIRDYYQAL